MLKASGFDVLFAAAGNLYLLLLVVAVALVLWKAKGWPTKTLFSFLVVALFLAPIAPDIYRAYEYRQRYAKAEALFEERCKTAGKRIHKKVSGVSEILLVNPRERGKHSIDIADPHWVNAGFPRESTGLQYVMEFLYTYRPAHGLQAAALTPTGSGVPGYRHVHVAEAGIAWRYGLRPPELHVSRADPLESYGVRERSDGELPRYSVEYENIDDPEGRKHWVAGGKIKVTDRASGELLGEYVRFSFEPGLGSRQGFRQPWAFARVCPEATPPGAVGHIRLFVQEVLVPEGDAK